MAKAVKVRRLVNPHKRKRNAARRNMTAKQIRFFGSKQQKAALKRKRRQAAPVHRKRTAGPKRAKRRVTRQANPALVLTLGAVNPRREAKVAKARRRNRKRVSSHRSRKANPRRVFAAAPRRHTRRRINRRHNPVRHHRRYRNPEMFGLRGGKEMGKAVAGGLVGVAAAKFIPTMIPAGLVQSNLMRVIATGVAAFVAGWAAGKVDKTFGQAVLFGGLMQTGSVALNTFVPSIGRQIGLSGLQPARFPIPQNPIRDAVAAAAASSAVRATNMAGTAAFRSPW